LYNDNSSPALTNVTFSGNTAAQGGGVYNWTHQGESSDPTLTNVSFSGNTADTQGGGMYNWTSNPALTNVTFSGNNADEGGGMANWNGSSPTLDNCILWGNTATNGAQIYNGGSSPTISYSDIQGSGGSGAGWDNNLGTDGDGNIDADPQFVDADGPDDVVGTPDDDLRLGLTSPAINAGDNSAVTVTTDLDGQPRIQGGTVDMGAYEAPSPVCLPLILKNHP
jgi:predicted outer membrane repeat protein